uniref:hypothetical protein n=1 Tax=Flavobacterium sp. TaxID=239 RepID=UPI0025FF77EB
MNLIRKQARKIAIMLSLSLLLISCSQYDSDFKQTSSNVKSDQMLQRTTNENGIDIFKSIFFGIGNLANNVQQLKSQVELTNGLGVDKRKEVLGKLDTLIEEINNKYPTFFENFKKQITSGEQLQIKIAIEQGSMMIKENIEIIFPEFTKVFKKVKSDIYTGKLKFNENDNFNDYVDTFQKAYDN